MNGKNRISGPGFQCSGVGAASDRKKDQSDRDGNLCVQPFTARYAQDAKNSKILFFITALLKAMSPHIGCGLPVNAFPET